MPEPALPDEWAYVADLPLSDLAPRRVLADVWEDAGDPAGPALRQLCDVLDRRAEPRTVDAWPSALHRAALTLFPRCRAPWGLRRTAWALLGGESRLDRLTPQQRMMVPVWRSAWLRVSLATGPTDEGSLRAAVDAAYAAARLPPPRTVAWYDSPARGAAAATQRVLLADPAAAHMSRRVWDATRSQAWDELREQVTANLAGALWGPLTVEVIRRLDGGPHAQMEPVADDWLSPAGYGQHDPFMPYYSFWYAVGGIRSLGRLDGVWRLAEFSGRWWAFRDLAILTRRPAKVILEAGDPAWLRYADGLGVAIPAELGPRLGTLLRLHRASGG